MEPIESATWIWCDAAPELPNRHAYFRRTFTLAAAPREANVQCGADTRYRLYVNGVLAGFGPARGALAEPAYDTHPIAHLLRAGENVIAFHVHAFGKVERCSSFIPIRGGLIAAIRIDGQAPILTDASWKTIRETAYRSDTPRHSNHQGYVECFDARLARRGWSEPAFDDSGWTSAVLLGRTGDLPPWKRLVPRAVPFLTRDPRLPARIVETGRLVFPDALDPSNLTHLAPAIAGARRCSDPAVLQPGHPRGDLPATLTNGYAIFDFAENAAGFVRLHLRGEPGSVLNLAYSESLAYGVIESNKQGVRYVDRIILGEGDLDHTITLPKTFRFLFVQVTGTVTFQRLAHEVSHYPFRWAGRFSSSDQSLDAIWRVGAHTLAISTEDVYMDTPRRERAGWLGDMLPESMAGYHAFGDTRLARHSLGLFLSSQDQKGLYLRYPENDPGWLWSRYPSIDPGSMPDYNASVAIAARDYVLYSGDTDFAKAQWSRLVAVTDYILRRRKEDGLITFGIEECIHAAYILIDWAPFDRTGACGALNMLFHGHLLAMAELAAAIGRREETRHYRKTAAALAAAIRSKLFDRRRGLFVNSRVKGRLNRRAGYQENLLALLAPVADEAQIGSILRRLLPDDQPLPVWEPDTHFELYPILKRGERPEWNDAKLVPIGSPYFTYFALWALFEMGRSTAALNTIRRQYGESLARGATSFWEEWNGSKSHSHGWGAGPIALLARYIAGIQPTSPGFATCDILPDPADLKHACVSVPTPRGMIEVAWKREATGLVMEVSVPDGVAVRAGLPSSARQIALNGKKIPAQRLTTRRGTFAAIPLTEGRHQIRQAVPRPA